MTPRIIFVIMSAVHSVRAVDELARALAPHRVLIHHDFGQTPDFPIGAPNAAFVPNPKRTGWACWGFSEGIFHSLRIALEEGDFDYLQLLSPACLPIKPLREFEAYIAGSQFDAHFDSVDVAEDLDALMSVGYRAYSPEHSLRHRLLRRLTWEGYYGKGTRAVALPLAGVTLMRREAVAAGAPAESMARSAVRVMRALRNPRIGRHIFNEHFHPHFGSTWFGARCDIVARIADRFQAPEIRGYFSRLRMADEFLVPTLLRYSGARQGPSNHLVNSFSGASPNWFGDQDFDRLRQSRAFFARKFRDDPSDPVRRRVLDELVAGPSCAGPATPQHGDLPGPRGGLP